MEFNFDINNLFGPEISKLDNKLIPFRSCPGSRQYKEQLTQVVDQMGEASAKAQGLRGAITAADKMRHTDQILYVIKEAISGENSRGCVVGILKIGHKKLFVYDGNGMQHEVEPLCVLDFYVHESRQRKGCGRRLFDFMLQDQHIKAQHMAVDRPSHKFSAFLQKHYQLKATIPQVNNFTIFTGFFQGRNNKNSARGNGRKTRLFLYNRSNSNDYKPPANLQQQKEALQNVTARPSHGTPSSTTGAGPTGQSHPPSTGHAPGGATAPSGGGHMPGAPRSALAGKHALYSRHQLNPTSPLPGIGSSKQSSANSMYGRKVPSPPHPVGQNPSAYQDRRGGHLKIPTSSEYTNQAIAQMAQGNQEQTMNKPLANHQQKSQPASQVGHRPKSLNQAQNQQGIQPSSNTDTQSASRPNSLVSPGALKNGVRSNLNAYEKQILAMQNGAAVESSRKDVLLPTHFTPYADLKLPPPDPYARRTPSHGPAVPGNTNWNVLGVVNAQQPATGYASPHRFKDTRPW